jgi:hypothetical protein
MSTPLDMKLTPFKRLLAAAFSAWKVPVATYKLIGIQGLTSDSMFK